VAKRAGGWEWIDPSANDDERIEHNFIEARSGSFQAKAVRYGTRIGGEDKDSIGRTSKLAICRFERAGRTREVEHLKARRNIKADRMHGRIIGKFDLPVI